MREKVSISKE